METLKLKSAFASDDAPKVLISLSAQSRIMSWITGDRVRLQEEGEAQIAICTVELSSRLVYYTWALRSIKTLYCLHSDVASQLVSRPIPKLVIVLFRRTVSRSAKWKLPDESEEVGDRSMEGAELRSRKRRGRPIGSFPPLFVG